MFAWWKWPLTSKEGRFTHRFFSEAHNSREIIRLHGATANLLDLNWSITMIIVNFSAHHQTRDNSCTIKAIPILRVIPLIEGALMKVCIYRLTKITSLHGNCLTLWADVFGHNEEHMPTHTFSSYSVWKSLQELHDTAQTRVLQTTPMVFTSGNSPNIIILVFVPGTTSPVKLVNRWPVNC